MSCSLTRKRRNLPNAISRCRPQLSGLGGGAHWSPLLKPSASKQTRESERARERDREGGKTLFPSHLSHPPKASQMWGANLPQGLTDPSCPAEEERGRERVSDQASEQSVCLSVHLPATYLYVWCTNTYCIDMAIFSILVYILQIHKFHVPRESQQ